jgi:hypothetical protein
MSLERIQVTSSWVSTSREDSKGDIMKALIIIFLALLLASCNTVLMTHWPKYRPSDGEVFYTAESGTFRLRYKVTPRTLGMRTQSQYHWLAGSGV